MDTTTAQKLLEKTFKNEFNMDNYEYFLTELLNTADINRLDKTRFVPKQYHDYVNNFYELGSYEDEEGELLYLCAVELKNEGSRDRARTMQRNLIAKQLEMGGAIRCSTCSILYS